MKNSLYLCLLISLTVALAASAGTFTNSFNSGLPSGTAVYGNAVVRANGGVSDSGCLQMNTNLASQTAGFLINDLDGGANIGGFTATFKLLLGGGSSTAPADGFSFNFANDLPNGVIAEEGAGSGLTVEFDTYENDASTDLVGIDLKWNGTEIATYNMAASSLALWPQNAAMDPSYWADVSIQLHSDSTLDLTYAGTAIYTSYYTGFVPSAGRFGFGARTGGAFENCLVDSLSITTAPPSMPQFMPAATSPTGTNVPPNPLIKVQMWDGSDAQVAPGTIQFTLNSASVTPTVTKTGLVTTVQYLPPAMLPPGSTNTVEVSFADNSGSPTTQTTNFSFVVANFPTIPASYAGTAATASPGFTQRIFQGGTSTVGTIANAENLLGGFLKNPATGLPFPNTARTNTDGTWTFVRPTVLNYNIYAPTNTTSAGNFTNDVQYPGMPGTNGSLVNFAYEAVTYLHLTAGAYTFGVNSDDGFRMSCLDRELGVYDAGRGAADTLFSFAVAQTGDYPFRLVHFQGSSAASLEWFSMTPAGQKILINDTSTPGYIVAYSRATTSRPYFLGSWPSGDGNRPDQPIRVQMQDGTGIQVNTNSIRLTLNGLSVTPSITQTGGVTTVQYSRVWTSGSTNDVVIWFADNQGSPVSQTNQFTFNVSTYLTIPSSYALSGGAVDTTKPGFALKVFQTDQPTPYTIANAEIMLAGEFTDAAGNPYPNKAAPNTDGSWNYTSTNVVNYNIAAPAAAGNFANDLRFPGIPGSSGSSNTFAVEGIAYLYLPAGYYVLGVNSDDGFRLTTAPNPHEQFPLQVAVFDGTRGAADTTSAFAVTQAGYYPFRLVYFQATAPASLELFSVVLSGQKILVNDTNTPGCVRAYRSATDTQPYVQWAYPYREGGYFVSAYDPVSFTLVDGSPAVQLGSIQLSFNGTVVTPTVTRLDGGLIYISYVPTQFQQAANTTPTVQLVWADASGHYNTNAYSFVLYGKNSLAPLWSLPPGSRPYLTNDASATALEAGMGYNPVTGHLVLGSITNGTSVRGFYILDPQTGGDLGQLRLTNTSGNIFAPSSSYPKPGYSVGVADDGAIYAANRKDSTSVSFRIYRWTNETSMVNVAYNEPANHFSFPLGWDFRVRGSGASTQIICGGGNGSSTQVVLFRTTDGVNFTDTVLSQNGSPTTTDVYGGIAFWGTGPLFFSTAFPGGTARLFNFSASGGTATLAASYSWTTPAGSIGPFACDKPNLRIVTLATSTSAGAAHAVNLFDETWFDVNSINNPVDSVYVPTSNANPTGSGAVAFTPSGNMVFVLDSQNGLMAYQLYSPTAPVPVFATHISSMQGTNLTYWGGSGSKFVLVKSATPNTAMTNWTRFRTNTATPGSFAIPAVGSGAPVFYRIKSE